MCSDKRQGIVPIILAGLLVAGGLAPGSRGADRNADAKKEVVLPKDAKVVVVSYDPGAGGFVRKGPPPFLQIRADGRVLVTNLHDGTRKEGKLTARQLQDLLQFVIKGQEFFKVTEARIAAGIKAAAAKGPFIAVGGAGTSVIAVHANGKKHEVKFRAAGTYLRVYPKVEELARFAAVEKRLADLARSVAAGK